MKEVCSPLKHFLKQIKIIPAALLYPQPEPNIAYGLPSFPLVGAAAAVVGVGSAGANACIHLF